MASEECLICGEALEYLEQEELMECEFCKQRSLSNARCVCGHFVCDECHTKGVDTIVSFCLDQTSKNPFEILRAMMDLPFCHMHGPEHHIMVGSALLCAFKNAGGEIELRDALMKMQDRGRKVPGGTCGFWGACGAGISTGMFVSIVAGANPLAKEAGLANQMTSASLAKIGELGGPRCCKRNAYLAMKEAVAFAKEHFGVQMEEGPLSCTHAHLNNQCLKEACPFF